METKEKKEVIIDAELRSTGVQNLLDRLPHWLILKANFLISSALLIFLVFIVYFVRYPEYVNSNITIISHEIENSNTDNKVLTGVLTLSKNDFTKIKIGQKVIVRLYDFPYEQFGIIEGQVQSILPIPNKENRFLVNIIFPKGLKTTYNKNIPLSKKLRGSAEIVIQDLRLFEHFRYLLD